MLINGNIIKALLDKYKIDIRGVIHLGAHECEERSFYNNLLKITDDKTIWIDGNKEKVEEMKRKGFNNIWAAVIDESEKDVVFNITNNSQASSILKLNHQDGYYKDINIINSISCRTEKLSTFLNRINKDVSEHNFWNLDIQGTELFVLRGSKELLEKCDAIYTEVNSAQVYKDCGLINEIDLLLGEYGFERVVTKWTDLQWGDALYLKIKK